MRAPGLRGPSLRELAVNLPFAPGPPANWPPLILNGVRTRAIVLRDLCLTAMMWLIFVLMLQGEAEILLRLIGDWLGPMVGWVPRWQPALGRVGFNELAQQGNWWAFLQALAPYLALALLLIIALGSFAIDTINRRRAALKGPRPPPLPLAVEAHHAELASMPGPIGAAAQARRAAEVEASVLEDVPLDPRALLLVLDQLDEAALEEARRLRITRAQVTADGHYRIWPDE